ncbi:MAG: calcium-binding protein, partial [Symploca sp. SIO2G7]|nr:calcium-binding protein [Symploca sp. SIO2G7]
SAVSLSTDVTSLIESENTVITFNFEVDGEIPEGGLPISLDVDAPDLLWITDFFNFSRTDIDEETGQFNSIFILPNPSGLGGEISSFSGSLLVRDVLEPFDSIPLILAENTASFELNVFDDPFPEETESVSFSVGEGEGYTVTSDPVTVTIQDSPEGIVNPSDVPVINFSISGPDVLVEDDPDNNTFTLNFDVDGEVPEEGITVIIEADQLNVLPEFGINTDILRDDEGNFIGLFVNGTSTTGFSDEITQDGVTTSSSLRPIEFGRGVQGTIVESTATFSIDVNNDSLFAGAETLSEGLETISLSLVDTETYNIGPSGNTVTITIADPPEQPSVIGADGDDELEGTVRNETIAGELGSDIIMGSDGNDVLRGDRNSRDTQDGEDGGNDIIFGGDGNDRIGGKAGDDILSGDAGDDIIWGDDGNDILMGVTGDDILVGDNGSDGSGSDLFVFGLGDGTDTVLDFEVGIDAIGIVEGEFTFAEVTLTQDGENTLLGVSTTGETLAILNNVQASAIGESDFITVPDVSNPSEALAII